MGTSRAAWAPAEPATEVAPARGEAPFEVVFGDSEINDLQNPEIEVEDLADEDGSGVPQEFGRDFREMWPFLSNVEAQLSEAAIGASLGLPRPTPGADFSPLDAAILAAAAGHAEAQAPLRDLVRTANLEAQLPGCGTGTLATLLSALGAFPGEARCGVLRRRVAEELLKRRPLRARHAACLLASLGERPGEGTAPPTAAVLAAAVEVLLGSRGQDLDVPDTVAALEGLARAGVPAQLSVALDMAVASQALLGLLGGGAGLARLVVSDRRSDLPIRALAALQVLPQAGASAAPGALAAWPPSLRGVRWPRELVGRAREEDVAAAACYLARCDAWDASRCSWLLSQALRRDLVARHRTGDVSAAAPALPAAAAALWLCAVAQSGKKVDEVMNKIPCKEPLLAALAALAAPPGAAKTDADAIRSDVTAAARALWALCALGLQDEQSLGESFLARLAAADAESFSLEVWALLREVQVTLVGAEPAPADGGDAAADAAGGAEAAEVAEAAGEASSAAAIFASDAWRHGLAAAHAVEKGLLAAGAGRAAAVRAALPAAAELVAAAMAAEAGEEAAEAAAAGLVVEEDASLGPYSVVAVVRSHGVALDLDVHQGPVSRTLRRQQWAALAPDLRVAELTLAAWDAAGASRGSAGQAELLARRLMGIEDAGGGTEDDD